MDPLSDVLSLLKPRSYMFGGLDLGGDWSIRFPPHTGIRCYALVAGQCWLAVDGVPEALLLSAGDCVLLPRGRGFVMARDLSLTPVDYFAVVTAPLQGHTLSYQGGGDMQGIGGYFALGGAHADFLLGMLPPIVHLRDPADQAELRWVIARMMQELRTPRPGAFLMAQQLAQLLLIQALRLHGGESGPGGQGWLFALADPQLAAALNALHADPAHPWTVQSLATSASMSRTSFALKFKALVGMSPIDYLTQWRMRLAAERLLHTDDGLAVIARRLGYDSESAFGTAFKRVMGQSPRQYSRAAARSHSGNIL